MARIEIDLDLEDLPYELSQQLTDTAWLRFMMSMNEERADLQLSKRLRARLETYITEGEEEDQR